MTGRRGRPPNQSADTAELVSIPDFTALRHIGRAQADVLIDQILEGIERFANNIRKSHEQNPAKDMTEYAQRVAKTQAFIEIATEIKKARDKAMMPENPKEPQRG